MQASLPKDLVPIGATNLLMVISTSCAVFLSVGQTVFQEQLDANLSFVLEPSLVRSLTQGGVNSIRALVSSDNLPVVLRAYSNSTTHVFVSCQYYNVDTRFRAHFLQWIPAVAPIISFVLVACCKWTSAKAPNTTKKTTVAEQLDVEAKE
jgi:hypothetical protein